jgi:endo-1,4-beta-xylanase
MINRREFLGTAAAAIAAAPVFAGPAEATITGGLRDIAAKRGLTYGCNINVYDNTLSRDPDYAALVARESGLFVCSRAHWDAISPTIGETRFAPIDADYAWARAYGMPFRGHCLVWHERMPAWFAALPSRDTAIRALETHVAETCRHFAGRMHSWDVVNEAIKPVSSRDDSLRPSVLLDRIGPEFLDIAFRTARENDPKARLVYNDFDFELNTSWHRERRHALLDLLDGLKQRGVPIDAVGLQSHLAIERMRDFDDKVFAKFVDDIAARGVEIWITELDVIDRGAPSDIARRDTAVAEAYQRYLDVALANRAVKIVITWGITDRYGWIVSGDYPQARRADGLPPRPLPFDTDCRPKPAYLAIAEAFNRAPART